MLRFIRIRNLAVIETAEVDFDLGFSALTGETGAGKSILVDAVALLLGGRASADLVRTGEKQASIEAIFEDEGAELVIRRDITNQGRSRSFVNGALVTSSALRELSLRLVELHGQHEHQALLDPATHLGLVDAYARLEESCGVVADAWSTVAELREQLERSGMDARERATRLELVGFQLGEIERVAPKAGEDDELATLRQVLASAERVQRLCEETYSELYERDGSLLSVLAAVRRRLSELGGIDPEFGRHLTVTEDVKSQLEDLAFHARDYGRRIDASPGRLREVEDRLAALERLKRKFGRTLGDVIERGQALSRERELLSDSGGRIEDVRRSLEQASSTYLRHARDLSARRRDAASSFSKELERLLGELAMDRTKVEVRFNDGELRPEEWSGRGVDTAEFFLSPNPGEELRPLARIVSGGELSRIMLAFKTLTALRSRQGSESSRTLIFDEVDSGIGGRVADVVGERLQELGRSFQVLCITHLPQIAARATSQFRITKSVRNGRTSTAVERLDDESERVTELGRMMSGANVTDSVRQSARELLARGQAKGERRKRK